MFEGYKDPVLDFVRSLSFISDAPAMDKFGFFYKKNASATFDGIFNVGTGGSHPLGQIYEWNYNTNTTFYDENCSSFKGSAGDFFPKYKTSDILEVFHSDLCRTILLDYEKNATIHGIEGLKYVLDDHSLDNGTKIPGNKCTCGKHCLPYGVIYATACKGDTPNYLSLPHFYKADPSYADKLIGIKPDKEKHDFYIIYEPTTGIPLQLFPRLQINIRMSPVSYIGMYEDIPSILFPVLWFEQSLAIPSTSALLVKILLIMKDICLSVGIVLITLSIVIFLFLMYRIRKSDFRPQEHHKNYLPKELVPLKEKDSQNC
ncbi:hypothetical protein WA026_016012 [Henosepilachna vigintioctopunctata]|uniref:Uncharacterized protein n=1 Tax=Henosepilachna vigintioctopunctata TaxID=420089 RepID=A0AAW1U8K4_9CUCU